MFDLKDEAESTRKKKGLDMENVCTSGMISGWKLDLMAMKILSQHLLDATSAVDLAKKILETHQNPKNELDDSDMSAIQNKEKELQKVEKRSAALLDLLLDATISKDEYVGNS